MGNRIARDFGEVLRDELVFEDRIAGVLREGPKTIPEIAEALGYPSHEVMLWVMAMWRYGKLIETGKANKEGYFQYQLKE